LYFIINLIKLDSCLQSTAIVPAVHFNNTEDCQAQENIWHKIDENT